MPQTSPLSNDVATEPHIHPNWHAFGMLVVWVAAGIVLLLSYVQNVAHSLDGPRLALITSWLLWLAYLAILARASIARVPSSFGPAALFVVLPFLLWGVGKDLQMLRGFPATEAVIISTVNIFLGVLPASGIIAQHVLFLSVASTEHWVRSPPTGIAMAAKQLLGTAANFAVGISACLLLCCAHNRRLTLQPRPSALEAAAAAAAAAAGGEPAEGHPDKKPLFGGPPSSASQPGLSPRPSSSQLSFSRRHSSSQPSISCRPSGSQTGGSRRPSANPASPPGLIPLLKSLCFNASIIAWVQRAELWLLAVPQDEAQLLISLLSAFFAGTRFLAYAAHFTAPGSLEQSPTMDMLGLLCGMMVGGFKISEAHVHRAYRSVRGLLRNIMPAHVADALEAYEAERELAEGHADAFSKPSGDVLQWQTSDGGKKTSFSIFAGVTNATAIGVQRRELLKQQSAGYGRNTSETGSGGPPMPWPRLRQSREGARSWSGNLKSLPSGFSSALARSRHSFSSRLPSEHNNPLGSEHKLGLDRRHSFSERHEQVTLLFADIVNFTNLSDQLHPSEVMTLLGDLYKEYDQRAVELGLYTCDTIGDCYMCAANLTKPLPNHVSVMVGFGRDIIEIANATISPLGAPLSIRVGIHTGPLMSGIIGVHHLKFTLLGDTVNCASRMETTAIPNTLQISEDAYKQLQREQLAMLSGAAEDQDLAAQGSAQNMQTQGVQSQAREECDWPLVRGNSAPVCSLESMPKEKWEEHSEYGAFLDVSRSAAQHGYTELDVPARQQQRQQQEQNCWHYEDKQEEQQQQQQQQRQQQQQQQHPFHPEPRAHEMGGQDMLQEPRGLGAERTKESKSTLNTNQRALRKVPNSQRRSMTEGPTSCSDQEEDHSADVSSKFTPTQDLHGPSLSPGDAASCTELPAEQKSRLCAELSSYRCNPADPEGGPAVPICWLERELDIKGKGVMKTYTWEGTREPGVAQSY